MNPALLHGLAARAAGIFIGFVVGLKLATAFEFSGFLQIVSTVVGMLVGGTVAWATVDFRGFLAGASRPWHKAAGWRPDMFYWKHMAGIFFVWLAIGTMFTLYAIFAVCGPLAISHNLNPGVTLLKIFTEAPSLVGAGFIGWIFACCAVAGTAKDVRSKRRRATELRLRKYLAHSVKALLHVSPPGLAYNLVRFVRFLYRTFPVWSQTPRFIWWFLKYLYIEIHTSVRAACFFDAALGVGIGLYFNSLVWGMAIGLGCGVVNHFLARRATA